MKVIDMHCDTIADIYRKKKGSLRENDGHVDLLKMKKGDYLLQNFAVFTDIKAEGPSFTYDVIDFYRDELRNNEDLIRPVYKYKDIEDNQDRGVMSALLTLEEASVIDGDLNSLERFYDLGVRMITLTWNYANGIGHPNFEYLPSASYEDLLFTTDDQRGLTPFGIETVKRINDLGIIVDVSHLSDRGFEDVLKYSDQPFVASHSDARSIHPVARNLTDEMIRKLADKGGVMGINFCADFLSEKGGCCYIEDIVRHIRHIVNVGGIDCVGFGSDFDGIDNTLEFKDCSGMQQILNALTESGFTMEECEKIFYKNVLRLYQTVIK